MTKDNVTIHVDAVAFYKVKDPLKVLCNIEDGNVTLSEAAQVCTFWVALLLVLAFKTIDADLQICVRPRCEISYCATFDEVVHNRDEAGRNVLAALRKVTDNW